MKLPYPILALLAFAPLPTGGSVAMAEAPALSGFPVDVAIPKAPAPVLTDGRARLLYELRVTNFHTAPIDLAALDLLDDAGTVLAHYAPADLVAMIGTIGPEPTPGTERTLAGGRTGVVFIDLALPTGAKVPARLGHRLTFSLTLPDGKTIERSLTGPATPVDAPAVVIAPPLAGDGWLAANGLAAPDHRRSWNAINGRAHLAQRFAIDWIRLDNKGRFLAGDPGRNESYPGYGAPVLAVADARVVSIINDLPENAGANPQEGRRPTVETISGNTVILDLGNGAYALYGHLQTGSVLVHPGEAVHTGQVLAKLGNSGNSDAPHLHFQLMDAPSALGAEGLPYAIARFTMAGVASDPAVLDGKAAWKTSGLPHAIAAEFPDNNAVVSFP